MKRINLLCTIFLAAILFTACENDLLDTKPYSQLSSANMWNNEGLVDLGVMGVYNTLRQDYVGQNRWFFDQDGFVGMYRDATALSNGNITSSDGLFTNYWKQNYEGIHRANDAIVNLAEKAPLSDAKKGRLIAECKFLRAWFYYNLNQVYKGVPIYLKPIKVEECILGRSAESEVWTAIINDLTDCINEPNLPNFYVAGNAEWGRVTKAAAYALRGKVYMWLKEYKLAEADLRKVGELGPKLYTGVYKDLFKEKNEQCPEMIFSVQNIGIDGLGTSAPLYLGSRTSFGSCWNNYLPHPDFVESFEEKDGKPFNWEDYLPGYNSMTPAQRVVFFLRDNLTATEKTKFANAGADMTKYLPTGNEARIRTVFANRDPRLEALVITPYATYLGSASGVDHTYTLRWPYRGADSKDPFDLRTDTNSMFYYLWRKWVPEGSFETPNRGYGPIDQPLIRYADVVLLLAEAVNEQGRYTEAVDLVNSVRIRAGAVALQTTDASVPTYVANQADMRERVRNERRWELALEGVNLFDEMRWGTWKSKKFYAGNGSKQIWGAVNRPYTWAGDYLYTWAIPQTEVEMNRNLIQNLGWIN